MSLRFKGTDLRPVLNEAITNKCQIILVKGQGVYFLAEHGERRTDGRQKLIAYAVGCNPDIDAFDDWWELANAELGGDDFAEYFDPLQGIFPKLLRSWNDLDIAATQTQLFLTVVKPMSNERK